MPNGTEGIKLVRKNTKTGVVEARKRGRVPPGFINGWLDTNGQFREGNPFTKATPAPQVTTGAADEIGDLIKRAVQMEVTRRLQAAKEGMMKKLDEALTIQ